MNTLLPLMGCSLLVISFGYVITFWFRAMFAFDKLIKYECENLPEQWKKDWQPRGMFWQPQAKKISLLNSIFLGNPTFALYRLTFSTPEWVRENPELTIQIKKLRKFVLFWNIGVLAFFFVLFPAILVIFTPR